MSKTLFDKIWESHVIKTRSDGVSLLYVDRHLVHDGTAHAFEAIAEQGLSVRRPDLTFGTADHYVNTLGSLEDQRPDLAGMATRLVENAVKNRFAVYGFGHPRQGIVHVVGPELGLTLPGALLVCGDSHTASHGALGALAFGIGASEIAHVLATQTLWQAKPKQMRITIRGKLAAGVTAKDVALAMISQIGADAGTGYVLEYAGKVVRDLSIEGRLTLCNMSIEAGARAGLVAPDAETFRYLKGRPFAPSGEEWERAVQHWQSLKSDPDATFDREVEIDGAAIEPSVTWGTSPQDTSSISGRVPDPASESDPVRRQSIEKALAYMDLKPGTPVQAIEVDRVFIGSCTNSRIEDLRAAAKVLEGRKVKVPLMVVPGSGAVKKQAEAEGLHQIFKAAGAEWRNPGCSMCVAMNGDLVPPGERCASTSNRNFAGRQGPGARTHLLSPAMAAAAAVEGHLTDVRKLEEASS